MVFTQFPNINLDFNGFGPGARAACVGLMTHVRRAHGIAVRHLLLLTSCWPAVHPYLDHFIGSPAMDGL
jgi:hypothetical protein